MSDDADLLDLLWATAASPLGSGQGLQGRQLTWQPSLALTVILAAEGYPGPYKKGSVISGIEEAEA